MGDNLSSLGNLTFKNMTLPGTHDSGTYQLYPILMPGAQSDKVEELIRIANFIDRDVDEIIHEWA